MSRAAGAAPPVAGAWFSAACMPIDRGEVQIQELAEGPRPFRALYEHWEHMDLHMLVLVGGMERTADEWRDLLATEAFEIARIAPAGPAHLIEARPV